MHSAATPNPKARTARHVWHAALFTCALASCASLGPDAGSPSPASLDANASQAKTSPAAQADPKPTAPPAQVAVQPSTSGEKPKVEAEQGAHIEGYLSSRLVERWNSGEHDLDSINLLSMDWSDPRHAWIRAHFTARISADLDGRQTGSVYNGLSDLHDQSVDFKLYDAYVDILPAEGLGQLRIGRQFEYDTPEIVNYDGLSLRTHPTGDQEFTAGLYGGVPVRLYQGTSDQRSVLGAYAEERPWKGGRVRFDWMHLEDETVSDSGNGILGLGLWQRFEAGWSGEAQYTRLEDRDRDLRMRAQWTSPNAGFTASATYYQLFQTQDQLPADIDPFTAILMALHPYQQYGAALSTDITQKIRLDLSVDARSMNETADVGEFNRDWERYRATTVFSSLLAQNLDVSLFGDLWDGDGRDTTAWGLDLSYDTHEQWKFGAGSYYSLYKYNMFQNSESDDVRTYYARATWRIGPKLTAELGYDFEDDDQQQYNALRGGVVWHF